MASWKRTSISLGPSLILHQTKKKVLYKVQFQNLFLVLVLFFIYLFINLLIYLLFFYFLQSALSPGPDGVVTSIWTPNIWENIGGKINLFPSSY